MSSGLVTDLRASHAGTATILKKPNFNVGGVCCENFSPLSTHRAAYGDVVRTQREASGLGYKYERECIRDQAVPVSLEEQVPSG